MVHIDDLSPAEYDELHTYEYPKPQKSEKDF